MLLLCAGWKDQFNLEDTLFAGAVVNSLRPNFEHFDDSSVAAEDLYLLAKDNLRGICINHHTATVWQSLILKMM